MLASSPPFLTRAVTARWFEKAVMGLNEGNAMARCGHQHPCFPSQDALTMTRIRAVPPVNGSTPSPPPQAILPKPPATVVELAAAVRSPRAQATADKIVMAAVVHLLSSSPPSRRSPLLSSLVLAPSSLFFPSLP
ncbi:hypothetical protein E2562_026213 [Oryza meyeriana var. granulata]|uniref:Uncharacterized protein n=1 Tax=Oryza meyeriana var. granulata TaxID=110450 RepID=A0A6G1E2X1_9ORYZ|nr:hypothetical protein E2562_026213 [Oryza meyeriana var. granulata]